MRRMDDDDIFFPLSSVIVLLFSFLRNCNYLVESLCSGNFGGVLVLQQGTRSSFVEKKLKVFVKTLFHVTHELFLLVQNKLRTSVR